MRSRCSQTVLNASASASLWYGEIKTCYQREFQTYYRSWPFLLMRMLKVNVHVQSFGQSFKIKQRLGLLCFVLPSKSDIFNIFSGLRRSRSISGPHFSRAQWLPTWTKGWGVAVWLWQLWQCVTIVAIVAKCGNCGNVWQCVAGKDQLGILHLLQILEGNVIWIAWKI